MTFFVSDKFRKNKLSFKPGGEAVEIFFQNGTSRIYSKVKNPEAFFRKARKNNSNVKSYKIL